MPSRCQNIDARQVLRGYIARLDMSIAEGNIHLAAVAAEIEILRVTGELDPRTRYVGWRVPALPTKKAVLALRAGGEEGDERIVLRSAVFTIQDDPSAPLEDIRFAHGEWRTREAGFEGVFPFAGPSLGTGPEERLFALATSTELAEAHSQSLVPPLFADGLSAATTDAGPLRPLPPRLSKLPRSFPKRE